MPTKRARRLADSAGGCAMSCRRRPRCQNAAMALAANRITQQQRKRLRGMCVTVSAAKNVEDSRRLRSGAPARARTMHYQEADSAARCYRAYLAQRSSAEDRI